MTRLDDYRFALLATLPDVADAELAAALEKGGPDFVSFIIDHGLGPLWHERTGRDEFHECRMTAEALYLAQEHALHEIDAVLDSAGIEFVVFKGAANRLLLNENPAIRACHDLDLLVRAEDRVQAVSAMVEAGFTIIPDTLNISHELVLSKGLVDVDLHWQLLREGRLRNDCATDMLDRRRRENGIWMLSAEDALFVLLVHPAFAKHLAAREMGLHRVADIASWLHTQSFDCQKVRAMLEQNDVKTAAWTTLRWVQLLTCRSGPRPRPPTCMSGATPRPLTCTSGPWPRLLTDTQPGHLRRKWLNHWLRSNISERTSKAHWARLLGFSLFLHDTPGDAMRALAGRYRAQHESSNDLEAFRELLS